MLTRLGHQVHILEQSTENFRHGQAAGIRAGPEAQRFLAEFDLHKHYPYAVDCPGMQFINKKSDYGRFVKFSMKQTSWTMLYYRLRANFDGLVSKHFPAPLELASEAGNAKYDLGKRVLGLTEDGSQVQVQYRDVATEEIKTVQADLVIGADGSYSAIRRIFRPPSEREDRPYAGYAIPGHDGSLEPGNRILNFVWYHNCPDDSEFQEVMTDIFGQTHHSTLQPGMLRPEVWEQQVKFAQANFAAPFVELVENTSQPFVAAVSDDICDRATFMNGKVILVGDALALFRPHIALSANQAAYDCLELQKVLKGEMSMKHWERNVLGYATKTRQLSVVVGTFSQYGGWKLIKSVLVYALLLLRQGVLRLVRWLTRS
ncbi:FAD/NAD(P)-binding domain-containing protein [Aureobasidium pullulans]|uniref:FAD/NAD(P)-binding domain-containing protein n=1 Tax=Aureobasidium pullulans TaxID=5580 RepID=A0AB74JF94_AURPU|nr:FAD/NAD(P)-binding domain-containing protein [Aureobasidium pullulans]TIA45395.1 FAD/NAD(P)-binding domain-containing protein [Aureobasidium pullulans]